jgi:biopolymer transport protein ExbB/TolQ
MDPKTQTWFIIFVVVIAAAVVWQALILTAVALVFRKVGKRAQVLLDTTERRLPALLANAQEIVSDTQKKLGAATTNFVEMTSIARDSLRRADDTVAEATDRARVHIVRLDETINEVVSRFESATGKVQRTVTRPVRDIVGIIQALRTGVDFFFRRRPSPRVPIERDEEMFI